MNKNKIIKIIVPIVIVAVVAGIWIFKNTQTKPKDVSVKGADFALAATAIDLDALKAHELPIIIDFGADSCIPCKEMAPVLKSLNEEMQGKAIIKFVDVWKYAEAAADFPVQVIPTQVIFDADGKPYTPSKDLGIELAMYSAKDTGEHIFTVHQGGLTEEQMRAILKDMEVE